MGNDSSSNELGVQRVSDDRMEAARQVLAASLTPEMGFYRPTDPADAAAAYVAGLKHHAVDDGVRVNQLAATNELTRLIRRGHELGLPPLHWSIGSGRGLSGYLVGASMPQPATEEDRVRAFLAWCAVLGVTAIRTDGKDGYADRWHSGDATLAPNVHAGLHYARDWFAEPCSVCSGNLPPETVSE